MIAFPLVFAVARFDVVASACVEQVIAAVFHFVQFRLVFFSPFAALHLSFSVPHLVIFSHHYAPLN